MGVHGLTPFLQKTCPSVLRALPNRLKDLKGKRLVIDATLITQRFHYAPVSHASRHVAGWYRIARELRDNDISAVCIFDGKERPVAKMREVERRRKAYRLTASRGSVEKERFLRLQKLRDILESYKSLDQDRKQTLARLLNSTQVATKDCPATLLEANVLNDSHVEDSITPKSPSATIADRLDLPSKVVTIPVAEPLASLVQSLYQNYQRCAAKLVTLFARSKDEQDGISDDEAWKKETKGTADDRDLAEALDELKLGDGQNQRGATTLSEDNQETASINTTNSEGKMDAASETQLTKAQHELIIEEGHIWNDFRNHLSIIENDARPDSVLSGLQKNLESMLDRSYTMMTSFERRMDSPTGRTYAESREILHAMGIPTTETNGATEAEALASSMVLNGLADYVVSEDTDVLVYDAPMIKNLTNHNEPLVVVSGRDVREALGLERESFVDFALLLGTDFSERIKNMGPSRAYKFMKEYGSIERILSSEPKYSPKIAMAAYLAQVEIARSVFRDVPPVPPTESIPLLTIDDEKIRLLMGKHDLKHVLNEDLYYNSWDHTIALHGNHFHDNPAA